MARSRFTRPFVALAGACTALPVLAGPPVNFGNWNNNGGNISSGCPSGYTCEINVQDQGIQQRILTDQSGNRFIQLIIDGVDSSGARMSSESFVSSNQGGPEGISLRQVLTTPNVNGDTLSSTAVINRGWADDGRAAPVQLQQVLNSNSASGGNLSSEFQYNGGNASPTYRLLQSLNSTGPTGETLSSQFQYDGGNLSTVDIQQSLDAMDSSGVGLRESFRYNADYNQQNVRQGYNLDVREDVFDSTLLSTDTTATGQDIHTFVTRLAGGNRVSSGSTSLPGSSSMGGMMMDGSGPTGGNLSWSAGDDVQVIWIGQICEGCQTSGGMGGGGMGGGGGGMMGSGSGAFSYQAYDNLSDSSAGIASRSIFQSDPINWESQPFGSQPSLGQP